MPERSIHILQMGKHFLYLPIYYAHHSAFFGYLPPNVKVVIDEPVAEHTDAAVYEQMMEESPDYRDSVMAIVDPTQVFRTPLTSERLPAVLATIVTNGAFWAINHGTYTVRGLRDLGAFDQVIAYDKGTTSYNIAVRIAHDSGAKKEIDKFIQIVAPGKELLRLSALSGDLNTFALSPDVLQIEEMTSRPGSKVKEELAIGATEEYNAVIVTALISSNHFVENDPEIVRGVVRGIQHALTLTRRADSDVLRFARSYFRYSNRAEGALKRAIQAGAVPRNTAVERPHWLRAARAYCEATGEWTQAEEADALNYYLKCIAPYGEFAEEAISIDGVQRQPTALPVWMKVLPFVAALAAIGITAFFGWIPAIIIAFAIALAWGIIRIIKKSAKGLRKTVFAIFGVTGILMIALPFIPNVGLKVKMDLLIALGAGFLIPTVFELINYVEREKK